MVEAPLLASGSVAMRMSIQSRGFARFQVLNRVSLSFAVDVITTSQSCDTASMKRETNTSCREQELSIWQEALHPRETNVVLREPEMVTQKGRPSWKSDAVNFKTRLFDFRRFEVMFEMDAVMKEMFGQLIAQFVANVITVRTDVAQDNCHATTVSRRNAEATARRLQFVRKAAVCRDALASKLDLCLYIGSHHGVDGRGTITQNSWCIVEPRL